jgi:hypothetical protein
VASLARVTSALWVSMSIALVCAELHLVVHHSHCRRTAVRNQALQ